MKIRITIIGVLEVEFEREVKVADALYDSTLNFYKGCIVYAVEEARKLSAPPDNQQPTTGN